MIALIQEMLEKEKIALWRITEEREQCAELYFIRKKLDMPRMKDTVRFAAVVYRDFEQDGKACRGSSTALIPQGAGEEEVRTKLRDAYAAAAYVKNPYFDLADPVKEPERPSLSPLSAQAPAETAAQVVKLMFDEDNAEDAFINSLEVFVTHGYKRVLTSHGTDVSWQYDRIEGEMVAQCVSPTDVEQYRSFAWDRIDETAIREKVRESLSSARDRACASGLPMTGTYPVLLKGDMLREVMGFYIERADATMVSSGYSDWKVGDKVQSAEQEGEPLCLSLASVEPYSPEGIPMPERTFVKGGELCLLHGPTRFCRYAHVEPVGQYEKVICQNGTRPLSLMRGEGVLEPVFFSDFQMDTFDGHFKGEIRLAYLHHADGTHEILTGGSVNGSLPMLQGRMVFSEEKCAMMNYEGPLAMLIPGVAVAGK